MEEQKRPQSRSLTPLSTSRSMDENATATTAQDQLCAALSDVATANEVILTSKNVTDQNTRLLYRYFVYSFKLDMRVVNICNVIAKLTAPFSRKAKNTIFEAHVKVKYSLRFLPILEVYCPSRKPPRSTAPDRPLSRCGSASVSFDRSYTQDTVRTDDVKDKLFSFRIAGGDGYCSLAEAIRDNRRITDKSLMKWVVQVLETVLYAHKNYITLGHWSAEDVQLLSDDSILEAYQEVRRHLYSDDENNLVGPSKELQRIVPSTPKATALRGATPPKTPDNVKQLILAGDDEPFINRSATMSIEEDETEKKMYKKSIVKGRVSRDAWLFCFRQLHSIGLEIDSSVTVGKNSARKNVYPSFFSTLQEYDPTNTGLSRIRYNDGAYAKWQAERDEYLAGMLVDYRNLGIMICELLSRREMEAHELNLLRKPTFAYKDLQRIVNLDKCAMSLCDLLKTCFTTSPYELGVELSAFDDLSDSNSSQASSFISGIGRDKQNKGILTMEQKFLKDINLPHQLKVVEALLKLLKHDWSLLSGKAWGEFVDIKEVVAAKERISGWNDVMEDKRLQEALERQKRNDELVLRGRQQAAARVTAHVTRVMFDMRSPESQRRILERERRRKESIQRARKRSNYMHKACFHAWPQAEMAEWCRVAILTGFGKLRDLLPFYRPKKRNTNESDDASTGSSRFPPISGGTLDFSMESSDNEEDVKRDVAEKRLVLETLSSFSRVSKRIQVMVDKKSSVDVNDTSPSKKSSKNSKLKGRSRRSVEDEGEGTDKDSDSDGSGSEDMFSKETAEDDDGSILSKESHRRLNNSDHESSPKHGNDEGSAASASNENSSLGTSLSTAVAKTPAARMTKIKRLLGLMEHKAKKPNRALDLLKKKKNTSDSTNLKSVVSNGTVDSKINAKVPSWAQPFKRKLTPEEIILKQNATYNFLGASVGKYLSTRSAPMHHIYRTASHQCSMHLSKALAAAQVQMMNNDIVKWLPEKEIAVKIKFTAVDILISKWTDLRECLAALAKRCDMLDGIYDWVSSVGRGVIMSLIELYLDSKADRDKGEEIAQGHLIAFFRMIVTRNKYKRIWIDAEAQASDILRKQMEIEKQEADKADRLRQKKSSLLSDSIGMARMLRSAGGGSSSFDNVDFNAIADGMVDAAEGLQLPWTFVKQVVLPLDPMNNDWQKNKLVFPFVQSRKKLPYPLMDMFDGALCERLEEIVETRSLNWESIDRVRPVESATRSNANVNNFFSDVNIDLTLLNKNKTEDESNSLMMPLDGDTQIEELIQEMTYDDQQHDLLMGTLSKYLNEPVNIVQSAVETSTLELLLGLDLKSSSWGFAENLDKIGASVFTDLSSETYFHETNATLVIVVDQLDRLKYFTSAVVTAAIASNSGQTMNKQKNPLLPNWVDLAPHGVRPQLRWLEVPYRSGTSVESDVSKTKQNQLLGRGNSELMSFDEGPEELLTGPQLIRTSREASRQQKRKGKVILSKAHEAVLQYKQDVDKEMQDLQDAFSGWTCLKLSVPGLVPNTLYNVEIYLGSQFKPLAKYRGIGVRLPANSPAEPGYSRIYVPKGLCIPGAYARSSLVATTLAEARAQELEAEGVVAIDVYTVNRERVLPIDLEKDGALKAPKTSNLSCSACTVPNPPVRVKLEIRRSTVSLGRRNQSTYENISHREGCSAAHVRISWTPSVCNGNSIHTYTVRRRLYIYISRRDLAVHPSIVSNDDGQCDLATDQDSPNFFICLDRHWSIVQDGISASHNDVTSPYRITPHFNSQRHVNVPYFQHVRQEISSNAYADSSGVGLECQSPDIFHNFNLPGCAYSDTIEELDILTDYMAKEPSATISTTNGPMNTPLIDLNDSYKVYLVVEYAIRAMNGIGSSQWSSSRFAVVSEHGRQLNFIKDLIALNREIEERKELSMAPKELEVNVELGSADHFPELLRPNEATVVRAKALVGVKGGVYNHAAISLLNRDSNKGGHDDIKTSMPITGMQAMPSVMPKNGDYIVVPSEQREPPPDHLSDNSFLARIAKASPLVQCQPMDSEDIMKYDAVVPIRSKGSTNHVQTKTTVRGSSIDGSSQFGDSLQLRHDDGTGGVIGRLQMFNQTKDLTIASESKLKRYQKKMN